MVVSFKMLANKIHSIHVYRSNVNKKVTIEVSLMLTVESNCISRFPLK